VALIRRRPASLPLRVPRPDGSTWPTRDVVGRASFAASAVHQMGYGEAFTPQAHDIVDPLLEQVLPRLHVDAAPGDLPHLRQLLSSAAQIGAGIGLVEQRQVGQRLAEGGQATDRTVAAALLQAADELPAMPAHQHAVATYLLHCGYYLARTGPAGLSLLLDPLHETS
jgi:hypothetical protein